MTQASGKPFFNPWRLGLIGVFALAVGIYLPVLHGKPVWEDVQLMSGDGTGGRSFVDAFTHSFLAGYYRPLTSVSFILDRALAGGATTAYHLTNILLHAATAVLLSYLTLLLTKRPLAGVLAGVCFAVQPAQLGAAAWIGGRTDVLSIFFIVGFLICLTLFHQTGKRAWMAPCVGLFLLASLTKEQSLALLPAVPISFFAFGERKWRPALVATIPFLLCGAIYYGLSRLPGKQFFQHGDFDSIRVPILTAADYGSALLFPTHQSQLMFSLSPLQAGWWIAVGLMFFAAAVWLGALLWKRNRLLAWIFFCGLLLYVPVSNLVPVPSFWVSPYRASESGMCLACLFGALGALAYVHKRVVLGGLLAANLAAGIAVTRIGTVDWSSGPRLNALILQSDPTFIWSHIYTIDELAYHGQKAEAMAEGDHLLSWLMGTPDWLSAVTPANSSMVEADLVRRLHTNFGKPMPGLAAKVFSRQVQLYLGFHKNAEATAAAREGLLFAPHDSDLNYQYGLLVMGTDRPEAIRRWEDSISVAPNNAVCAAMLGHALLQDGRFSEASTYLARAADEQPSWLHVWLSLADARAGLQDYAGALRALEMAGTSDAVASRKATFQRLLAQGRVAKLP